ncbi:MAG: hypothetical protein KF802_05775 [Bdellovibrionaceae bacterium]|nr:hypothetical protein [Pseudobdellovibrionaceae bacterium]MBX3032433.1 hypothetical protein [Pseudobdellovibrionaceae bacterium]
MKVLVFAAMMTMSAVALAKSNCLVAERDAAGNYSRVVANQDVEATGDAVILHQTNDLMVFASVSGEGMTLGFYDQKTKAVTQVANGNGTQVLLLNVEKGLAALCRQL